MKTPLRCLPPCLFASVRVSKIRTAAVTALLLLLNAAAGQTLDWVNQPLPASTFGGDEMGRAIARDASGNLYVTGYFQGTADFDPGAGMANRTSAGDSDIFIAKYDAAGNYLWAFRVGGTGTDIGYALAVDATGNIYVTGQFMGSNVDFDPGPGMANLSSIRANDIFIAKYDASGNYLWAFSIGSFTGGNTGYSLTVDGSGNVHVTGAFAGSNVDFDPGAGTANLSSAGSNDVFVAKYDASGTYLWAFRVGGTSADDGFGIALDGSGNVHVAGAFTGANVDFDPGAGMANRTSAGTRDIFIAKYDAAGNYLWAISAGGTLNDAANGLALDGSGNVYATGAFRGANVDFDPGAGTATLTSAGGDDIFLAKYDASGNYLWANRVGGTGADTGYGITVDGSGNAHLTGSFSGANVDFDPGAGVANLSSAGSLDLFIAKYDASGNYTWAIQTGGAGNEAGFNLVLDASGYVHATGAFNFNVDFDPGASVANLSAGYAFLDAFVLRLSSAGVYDWAFQIGRHGTQPVTTSCNAIARDASGNVCATGFFAGTGVDFDPGAGTANLNSTGSWGTADIFVAKYNAPGNYLWAFRVGGADDDRGNGLAVDGSGNVLVTGYFRGTADFDPGPGTANLSSTGGDDIFIAKYDAAGNYLWAFKIGGTGGDVGASVAVDGSGNVYVTGALGSANADFDPGAGTALLSSAGGRDIFIAKYDASGNYLWAFRVGSAGTDNGYSLAVDGSGNVHLTGSFQGVNVDFDPGAGTANLSFAGIADIFVSKYDASGNYLWAFRVGGTGNDVGYSLAVDGSGNVHLTGQFVGANVDFDPGAGTANLSAADANPDIFIAKYDASGNYLWAKQVGGLSIDVGTGLAVDGSGNVYATGYFDSNNLDFDPGPGTVNLSSAGLYDLFIAKYDASGNYLLAMQAGGTDNDGGVCIAVGGAGKINVGGFFTETADFDPGPGTASRTAVASFGDIFIAQYAVTPPTAAVTGNTLVCISTTLTLNGNPTGGSGTYSTHAWSQTGGAGSVGITNNNDGTADITGATAGSVTLEYTVTDDKSDTGTAVYTITVLDCGSIAVVNNRAPNDPCSCNNDQSANGARDGTFGETVSVTPTTAAETWTVVAISRLAGSGGVPTGIAANDLLAYDAGGFHAVNFQHVDDAGYTLTVEGPNPAGTGGNIQLTVSNICRYPTIAFDPSLPDNVCLNSTPIALTVSEENGFSGLATFTVDGNPDTQFDPSAPLTPPGPYPLTANFTGTFVNNISSDLNNPAFPGCMTDISDAIGIYASPVVSCPGPIVLNTSSDDTGDCDAAQLMNHPDIGTLCATTLEISFAPGAPAPPYLPAAGVVMPNGSDTYAFAAGQTIVTYTATDAANNMSSCIVVVTVTDNEAPTAVCPAPITPTCASSVPAPDPASVGGTDNCGIVNKTHMSTSLPNEETCVNGFWVTRVYRVFDAAGNSNTCSQVITVSDKVKPVFTFVPAHVTVQCNSIPAVGSPTASDGCGGSVGIAYNGQTVSNILCTDKYTLTRRWTATDACGNTQTATQRIVVSDTQKPDFTNTPANVTVQCDAVPPIAAPTATDNCDATVAVTYNGQTTAAGACPNAYTLTRRWTASDNCSNTRSFSQRIVVVDNSKPVFTSFPANTSIACHDTPPPVGSPTASDGCGSATVTYLGQTSASGSCPGNYLIRRTWRATDACGNSTVSSQTIQVSDTGTPVFTSVPGPLTIECGNPLPPLVSPTASDACGGYVSISFLGNMYSGSGCVADYTVTRKWRAEDLCGNSATTSQVITVLGDSYGGDEPPGVSARANDGTRMTQMGHGFPRINQAQEKSGEIRVPSVSSVSHPNLGVSPNPTTDRIWLDLTDFAGESVTVSIHSDLGRLIWERKVDAVADMKLPVNLRESGAAAGSYTVSVRGSGQVVSKRLVLVE